MNRTPSLAILTTAACLLVLPLTATPAGAQAPGDGVRLIDGRWDDWADDDTRFVVDEHHVTLRFETPDERTLLRHGQTVVVALDTDGEAQSGRSERGIEGADLWIELNPTRDEADRRTPAVRVTAYNRRGRGSQVDVGDLGLHTAPTHASRRFELRFDRGEWRLQAIGLHDAGPMRAMVWLQDHDSESTTPIGVYTADAPAATLDGPTPADEATLPEKPEGAIRVVSWNTLWGSQLERPQRFSRLAKAIDADVYLLQEWSNEPYTGESVAEWFERYGGPGDWAAVTTSNSGSRGSGVAVASRLPLLAAGPADLDARSRTRWTFPIRFAGAVIETAYGPAVFATVHHKAGGRLGAAEDQRRLEESAAIQRAMASMRESHGAAFVVYGGDFNLNGTFDVVDRAVAGLDTDDSALTLADAEVLGRPGLLYTHGRSGSKRRLDYISYPDAAFAPAQAFVVDTTVLPGETLRALGLNKNDSAASDHLPVVVDLVPISEATRSDPE
ncbi:MAG: endonuclease/exonuclease/phosphatase family protein [Planctomycetota bacterium]